MLELKFDNEQISQSSQFITIFLVIASQNMHQNVVREQFPISVVTHRIPLPNSSRQFTVRPRL